MALAPFYELFDLIIDIVILVLVVRVVLSWMVAFRMINTQQEVVRTVIEVSYRLTEPMLAPVRKLTDKLNVGNIDLAPIVVFLLLYFLKRALFHWVYL